MALADLLRDAPPAFGWTTGALFVASQLGIAAILGRETGRAVLAMQLAFSTARFQAIVQQWGADGLARFRRHFYLDLFHPLWYGAFFAYLLARVVPGRLGALVWVPVIAALGDVLENAVHAPRAFRGRFASMGQPWIAIGALCATAKWLLVAAFVVLFVVFAIGAR